MQILCFYLVGQSFGVTRTGWDVTTPDFLKQFFLLWTHFKSPELYMVMKYYWWSILGFIFFTIEFKILSLRVFHRSSAVQLVSLDSGYPTAKWDKIFLHSLSISALVDKGLSWLVFFSFTVEYSRVMFSMLLWSDVIPDKTMDVSTRKGCVVNVQNYRTPAVFLQLCPTK